VRPSSTSDDSDLFPITETDLALLVERANHLEELLAGGLLVFFVAAAGGAFAARQAFRGDGESTSYSARQLFYATTLGYAFVSSFYYYMLAQYYTSMGTVLQVVSSDSAYADLYKGLQIPTLGLPLDPGSYLSLRHSRTGLVPKDLTRSLALHAVLCPLLVCHAFAGFLSAGPLAPKGSAPREDQQEEQPYSNSPATASATVATR
jgi:hypothetical protein